MKSYTELVRRRLEDRASNILGNLDRYMGPQLRFTMRIFGDCLDEATRRKMFAGYSEHMSELELRDFARNFVPAYTEYAVAELEEKKRDGERHEPPHLTQEEYQEMAVREKWPQIAEHLGDVTPLQLRREIARAAMIFRPYMLTDPGFNEGVLEFSLYHDLLGRLRSVSEARLRDAAKGIAARIERAGAAKSTEEAETGVPTGRTPEAAKKRPPAGEAQVVAAAEAEASARYVQLRQRLAHRRTVAGLRPPDPDPLQESDDGGRPPGQRAQHLALRIVHRRRAGQAGAGQMLHQAEEEGELLGNDALFVEREEMGPLLGMQEVVGVLHAFGDALVGQEPA